MYTPQTFVIILHVSAQHGVHSVNVKLKLTLEQATKVRSGIQVNLYSFFNFGDRWVGWSMPRPGHFTPRERPGTHCIGGWVGLMADLDS
jgi:hypothetical protein